MIKKLSLIKQKKQTGGISPFMPLQLLEVAYHLAIEVENLIALKAIPDISNHYGITDNGYEPGFYN